MSHYDYHCNLCGHVWELNVPIADRDKACDDVCPACHKQEITGPNDGSEPLVKAIERIPAGPGMSYTYGGAKTPESFKDVLRNIKSKHLHSTINV